MRIIRRLIIALAATILTLTGAPSRAQTSVLGSTAPGVAPAGAAAWPLLIGGLDGGGLLRSLTVDGSGNLNTTATISGSVTVSSGVAQGSTTSGQLGTLIQGAVTTAQPSYTNAQTSPLSLTPGGNLRVSLNAISGAATDAGNGTTSTGTQRVTIASDSTGQVAISGTAAVNQSQVNGVAVSTGNGVAGTGVQRVTIASDNTAFSVNSTATGAAAAGAAASGNPVQIGGVYNSTAPTPSTGQIAALQMAENGQVITQSFATTANYKSAAISTASATTATLAANATSAVSIYITSISMSNTGSTASLVSLVIHSGATVWNGINPAGGGNNITFPTPIKITAATAVDYTTASASTTQYVNITYYLAAG